MKINTTIDPAQQFAIETIEAVPLQDRAGVFAQLAAVTEVSSHRLRSFFLPGGSLTLTHESARIVAALRWLRTHGKVPTDMQAAANEAGVSHLIRPDVPRSMTPDPRRIESRPETVGHWPHIIGHIPQ